MANPQTGLDKLKGALAVLAEPALIFAATGSKAAAIWGGLKAVIIGNVLGPLSLVSGALIGIVGAMKVFIGRTQMVAKGIDKLRSLEMIKTQFDPLLGGAALAQKRLEELYGFASSTPFQLEGIAEANRTLQVLTKGALATLDGMRLVGDAAAVTGQSMQTVSFWVGRLYDGLKSGAPIGEASTRLQEMGLISGDVRRKLNASADAGDAFTDTFAILEKELKKSEGGMEAMSQTLGGLESTLADTKSKFAGEFAKNFFEAEKTSTKAMINMLQLLEPAITRLGEVFSIVAGAVSKFFLMISGGQEGFKTLGNNLKYALDIFLAFGAAVAANQIVTLVASLARGSAGFTSFALSGVAAQISTDLATRSTIGLAGALRLAGTTFMQASASAKVATVGQFLYAGATKVATMALGLFASAAKAALAALGGPIGLIITGIVTVAMALSKMTSNAEEAAERTKKIKQEFDELSASIDRVIEGIRTFEDSLAAFGKIENEASSLTKKIGDLSEKAGSIGTFGLMTGEGGVVKAEIDASIKGYDMLINKIYEISSIQEKDLELGKQKKKVLEDELKIRKDLQKAALDAMMANASDAEQIAIMAREKSNVSDDLQLGQSSQDSRVAKEDFERGDKRREDKGVVQAMEVMLERTKAEMAKAEALIAMGETAFGDDLKLFGVEIDSLEAAKRLIEQKRVQQQEYKNMIAEANAELDAETAAMTGVARVTGDVIDNMNQADPSSMMFSKDMFPMGALAAFQERMKNMSDLTAAQREKLTDIVNTMKDAADSVGENVVEQQRLNDRMAEMQRIQERTIALFQLEQQIHKANMDLDLQGFQVSKKQNDIKLEGLRRQLSILQQLGDEQKSVTDLEGQEKETKKALGGAEAGSQREAALQEELATIQEQLRVAREMNKETTAIQNQIDKLTKSMEKMAQDLERTVSNIFNDIQKEINNLDIDEAFRVSDFGKAMQIIQAEYAREEERIQADRLKELKDQGVKEGDAKKIVSKEADVREKRREGERQEIRVNSDRDNQKAQLNMQARAFGDKEAAKQLQAMEDQDFFRAAFEKNIRAGMGDLEAQQFAQQDLDSKLMNEVPEMKVMADSFRRIGAGGAAAATDPMKILAERRLRVQELIQKDIATLVKQLEVQEDGRVVLKAR